MACWCEDDKYRATTIHDAQPLDGPPLPSVIEMNFCPRCGRDLRLPVARMYESTDDLPAMYEGERYFRREYAVNEAGRTVMGALAEPFTWAYVVGTLAAGYRFFGPVTVSPQEVPE